MKMKACYRMRRMPCSMAIFLAAQFVQFSKYLLGACCMPGAVGDTEMNKFCTRPAIRGHVVRSCVVIEVKSVIEEASTWRRRLQDVSWPEPRWEKVGHPAVRGLDLFPGLLGLWPREVLPRLWLWADVGMTGWGLSLNVGEWIRVSLGYSRGKGDEMSCWEWCDCEMVTQVILSDPNPTRHGEKSECLNFIRVTLKHSLIKHRISVAISINIYSK